ncbi:MAG: hypothetical protein WAM24_20755 [Ignavibacteriaceae bacterium]
MKVISLIGFLTLLICFPVNSQISNITVHHYDINLIFDTKAEAISIILDCRIEMKDNLPEIKFLLNNECKISSVKISKDKKWNNIPYKFKGDSLIVNTRKNYHQDHNFDLKFEYSFPAGKFNDTVSAIDRGERWYPLVMDQIASFKLTCEVPVFCKVLAAGNLISSKIEGSTASYTWESQSPVFKLPLIIFNPAKYRNAENDRVNFYYLSLDSIEVDKVIKKVSSVISYYSDIIAPYPYKKINLFEIKDFPGINTGSGLLMIGTQSLEMFGKGYEEGIILTVAQQWFGAGVFAEFGQKGFFFLSLSLPHYLRLMYIRHSEGKDKYLHKLNEMLDDYKKFAGQQVDIPIIDVDFPNTKEKGKILYDKGPWVLSKIDSLITDSIWIKFIGNLYKSYQGKILTYNDFINFLSDYMKNKNDLNTIEKLLTEKGIK